MAKYDNWGLTIALREVICPFSTLILLLSRVSEVYSVFL